MRRTLTAAAALVLLTACGGAGDGASSASEPPTSASETSAPPASSEFCTQAATVQARIAASIGGEADRSMLPQVLSEAATEIRAIEPPAELADDWSEFADGVDQLAGAAQIDFDDPAAVADLQQQAAAAQQQYGAAFASVTTYLTERCGLLEVPTETPAPPS